MCSKLRTFAGLVRDPVTKRFNDNDLAKLIHDATEAKAGMFRAHGTPLSKFLAALSCRPADLRLYSHEIH